MTNQPKETLSGDVRKLPMMPIRDMVIFPHMMTPFVVGRESSVRALEEALTGEHIELVLEDTDSPSNLAATGQNDILVRLRPEPLGRNSNQASRFWLWAATDNLRLNAQNAVLCALDLRRIRPQGKVQ